MFKSMLAILDEIAKMVRAVTVDNNLEVIVKANRIDQKPVDRCAE